MPMRARINFVGFARLLDQRVNVSQSHCHDAQLIKGLFGAQKLTPRGKVGL